MRKLEISLREMFDNHRNDYHEHIADWRKQTGDLSCTFPEFPSFCEWVGRPDGVPGGGTFRSLYTAAHYMKGSAGPQSSRHEYRTRQLQKGDHCL